MASPGALTNKEEVKLLVLYILDNTNDNFTADEIINIILRYELTDYFFIPQAIEELKAANHITDKGRGLAITAQGKNIVSELYRTLPFTVREKSLSSALLTAESIIREKQIRCEIKQEESIFKTKMEIADEFSPIMELTLYTPNRLTAESLKKYFLKNPEALYNKILESLQDDKAE